MHYRGGEDAALTAMLNASAEKAKGGETASSRSGTDGLQTLSDVKRNARLAAQQEEENYGRRIRMQTYTSEDSRVESESDSSRILRTFYCCICGVHSVVANVDIIVPAGTLRSLPRRTTDGAIAVKEGEYFIKLNVDHSAEKTLISRAAGIEVQNRFRCTSCGLPLGYTCTPYKNPSAPEMSEAYTYFFSDVLVADQKSAETFSMAAAQKDAATSVAASSTEPKIDP